MSVIVSPCATNAYTNERISIKISVLITFALRESGERERRRARERVQFFLMIHIILMPMLAALMCNQFKFYLLIIKFNPSAIRVMSLSTLVA